MWMDEDGLVTSLERIVRAEVGLTAVAFARVAPDLPLLQWRALVVAIETPEDLRVRDVAGRVGIAVPSASRLIRRLERRGLVVTRRDEVDRRVTRVQPTPRGREVHDAVLAARRSELRLAVSDAELQLPQDLEGGLAAIADRLDRLPAGA
jgi:DNA-binding MarR family transcriptional regulator